MEHKQTVKVTRIILSLAVIVGAITAVSLPASAVTFGGGSVQGYAADTPVDTGTIVQLNSNGSNHVKIATESNLQNMFGVTVDRNQLLVSSSNQALQNEAFVAISGTYNVLVSTEGGPIAPGDYVTLSSLDGVAMKASTEESTVFGRAVGSFDGKGVALGKTDLKDTAGKVTKTVTLGSLPVTVNVQHNPNVKSTEVNVPPILQRVGEAVAEKEVSPIRIYLSMAIATVSVIAAIAILYSGVRNSMISIGRNPMSKKSIFKALVEIVLTSILILIIGLFAVYLLLKL